MGFGPLDLFTPTPHVGRDEGDPDKKRKAPKLLSFQVVEFEALISRNGVEQG
jgi:hypothetical protein